MVKRCIVSKPYAILGISRQATWVAMLRHWQIYLQTAIAGFMTIPKLHDNSKMHDDSTMFGDNGLANNFKGCNDKPLTTTTNTPQKLIETQLQLAINEKNYAAAQTLLNLLILT